MSEETLLTEQEAVTEETTTETTETVSEGWMLAEEVKGEGEAFNLS